MIIVVLIVSILASLRVERRNDTIDIGDERQPPFQER